MTFKFVQNSKPGFRYTISNDKRDVYLDSGKFAGHKLSEILESRHGYGYIQYLIREHIVGDDFVAVFSHMAIDPEFDEGMTADDIKDFNLRLHGD